MTGDHHHQRPLAERNFLNARQHFHTIHARQPDIQQNQFEAGARQRRQRGLSALRGLDGVAFVFENAAQRLPDARLIVHHQDPPLPHTLAVTGRVTVSAGSVSTSAGNSTVKRAPTGWLSSTRICALCSATMWLTIASP